MTQLGDIYLADLGAETRWHVMVVSTEPFMERSGRALVAPEVGAEADEVLAPWRVRIGTRVFAVDLVRSIGTERLLDRVDRAPHSAIAAARRALRHIT